MIKSKLLVNNSGLPEKEVEQKKEDGTKKRKHYPVQDEGILPISDDYPEGIQYILKSTKTQHIKITSPQCAEFVGEVPFLCGFSKNWLYCVTLKLSNSFF